MRKKTKNSLGILYVLLCLVGLLYQVFLVCDEYLKYGVTASTTLSQTNEYVLPAISTCFEFFEIFDYDRFNESKIAIGESTELSFDESALVVQAEVSVSDIMKFTPDAEWICEFANIRNGSTFGFHELDGAIKCREIFIIEKFLISTMMCYKWTLKTPDGGPALYNRESAYFTPHDHGDIIFVYFNQTLVPRFDCITIVLHPIDNYPWTELTLTQERSRGYNSTSKTKILNFFRSKSSSISIYKLAPPYVTKCKNYKLSGYRDSFHCLSECIERGVQKAFGKASLSYHFFKPIDKLMLSYDDFTNKSFNATYRPILDTCNRLCPPNDCMFETTYTTTTGEAYWSPGATVKLPDAPSFEIKFSITVLFIDTINFVCSALGVWLGFSFMTINPFNAGKTRDNITELWSNNKAESSGVRMTRRDKIELLAERKKNDELRSIVMRNQCQIVALRRRIDAVDA